MFWRPSAETLVRRRLPLWDPTIGVTPDRVLTIDWLHDISLGPAQDLSQFILHELIHRNVFDVPRGTLETRTELSILQMEAVLYRWYEAQRRKGRQQLTQIQKLDKNMFGTYTHQTFSLKAAEANFFIEFLGFLLDVHRNRLPEYSLWRRAVSAMLTCIDLIRANPLKFPAAQAQDRVQTHNKIYYIYYTCTWTVIHHALNCKGLLQSGADTGCRLRIDGTGPEVQTPRLAAHGTHDSAGIILLS